MSELLETLPAADREFLEKFGDNVRIERHGANIHVIFERFDLGPAYEPSLVELMIQLPAGYPNMPLDMYWTNPTVRLASTGHPPQQCEVTMAFNGAIWQRWSRHPTKEWRTGIDYLQNFFASVKADLKKGI